MNADNLRALLKAVFERIMPDLDHYRKPLRKARVVKTYGSIGGYYCDVEILLNNEEPDTTEPIVAQVEIPIIWGGKDRGIVCPPAVGTLCDIDYYHGDPNYPRVSNFRAKTNGAPIALKDELIIQQQEGVYIHIKANSDIEVKTAAKIRAEAGDGVTIKTAADVKVEAAGNVDVTAGGKITVNGNKIDIDGGGGATGKAVTTDCICPITGAPHIMGSETVRLSK